MCLIIQLEHLCKDGDGQQRQMCQGTLRDWQKFYKQVSGLDILIVQVGLFFSGAVVTRDGQRAIVFGNTQFISNFGDSQYTFIDGTFKAVPRRPGFAQILTFFATCMDHVSRSLNLVTNNNYI